jgi:MoaA/NifB/PqqE/SkfB family radical SAM enzyme
MLKYCSSPWDTVHINFSGQVSSCFCSGFHRKKPIGSIVYSSLAKLIESDSQQEFRNSIIDQTFKYCREDKCVDFYRMKDVDDFSFVPNQPTLPTTIQLQIDLTCNLKCAICRTKNMYSPDAQPLAVSVLNRLVEEYQTFEHKVNIHCDGSGEVFASQAYLDFFNRNDLPKCFHFNIQSNGNLITKNSDLITRLSPQIEIVEISLDAATDETYKQLRGGNLSIVLKGIELLKNLGITVWTQYIIQSGNYKEIPAYIKLCKELGVDRICLQSMNRYPHMANSWWDENKIENNPNVDLPALIDIITEIKQDPIIEVSGGIEYLLLQQRIIPIERIV